MLKFKVALCVLLLASAPSCRNSIDLDAEKKEILHLHNLQRQAHIEKDASLLVNMMAADFLEVNHGQVTQPSKAESLHRFQSYFGGVDFVKWDDVVPPILSFSDDATMASTLVQKLVITREKSGNEQLDTTHYTWLAVYKKNDGKWEMQRMASTNR